MEETQFMQAMWTSILLDRESTVAEVANPDERLFFGSCPTRGKMLTHTFPKTEHAEQEAHRILEAIARARAQKRNAFIEYTSLIKNEEVFVVMHIEYRSEEALYIHAMAIDARDITSARPFKEEQQEYKSPKAIYDNLPIGLEIFDKNGNLIEINPQEMKYLGIQNPKDVLGLNLFDDPNFPQDIREQLRDGESVHFTIDYDFELARTYYPSIATESRHFSFAVSVVRNAKGKIDKYMVTSQDITERVRYQKKYELLYNETQTIIDSLPVGVSIYRQNGSLIDSNRYMEEVLGINTKRFKDKLNLLNNPAIPEDVKVALSTGSPIQTRFPFNFEAAAKQGYLPTDFHHTIHIECTGRPVVEGNGNYVFIFRDITKEVNTEGILRHNKKKTELAMKDADIMIWEYVVASKLFYSDNEAMNGYDNSQPLPPQRYIDSIHPEDRAMVVDIVARMQRGEDWAFCFDARVEIPGCTEWQYCTINGSPYERSAEGAVTKYVGSRKNNTTLEKQKLLQENILNSIPIPIHIKDVENDFRYVFCNSESTRMFGSRVDNTIYDVMSKEQVAMIEKTDREVFATGEPYLGLERIKLSDGRIYDTIVRKSVIYDGDKRLLLNVRWDQTLQNDLERRAKLLSLTMETMNAFTWYYEPDKTYISFGDGFDKVGRKALDINTLNNYLLCMHPDDAKPFADSLGKISEQEAGVWGIESRMDFKQEGVYRWWEARGMLETTIINDMPHKYMFGMTIDIDAHKQTEMALRKNKEELNALVRQNELVLNNTNSGLAFITPDYIVQWENITTCSTSLSYEAYKQGELCYKSAHNRTSPCPNCVMLRAFKSRQTEQIKFTLDNNHTVEIFGTPVINDMGIIEGIVIRVDDITEREQMIHDLQQAKAHAEQSDKLKSAFLANMSHEIRTPLNAIVGFSELLMTAPEEEEREEYLRIISNNNELLLKLINDILDLSKIEAGSVELKYEEFDLSEYFDGMTASMKQRITNPNVRLIAENPHPVCRVALDKNRVAQILTNYVTNAIKYTPKGYIEMGYQCVDEGIRFYVKDSGIGIAEEKKGKVFHRFEKLDEFAQGTGLGLSICKAIAESMGGSVGFESSNGEGSLFWAILPCDPDVEADIEPQIPETEFAGIERVEPSEAITTTGRKTILVAEDIASNYLLVSAILKKNYNLLHAFDGEEAVKMVQKYEVDLVLMDMKMPKMDGLHATALIRTFNPQLPIVALTAHAFDADRMAAIAAGCNDYLVKPIDKVKLLTTLRKYFGSAGS